MVYVYVIKGEVANRRYVGITQDVEQRVREHNSGRSSSTKPYIPWQIIHQESFDSHEEARGREKYLKSSAGRRWLKKHLG